jgi:hypothetical protein
LPYIGSHAYTTQVGELSNVNIHEGKSPHTNTTMVDQMDLLIEQLKNMVGGVAISTNSMKHLFAQATKNLMT